MRTHTHTHTHTPRARTHLIGPRLAETKHGLARIPTLVAYFLYISMLEFLAWPMPHTEKLQVREEGVKASNLDGF